MNYAEIAPPSALAPYVRCFWTLAGEGGTVERIVPDGSPELIFNRADPFRAVTESGGPGALQPLTLVVGQLRHFICIEPTGVVDLLGVRFFPHGLHAFLRLPLFEITDARADLAEVARPLERALLGPSRQGVAALAEALLARLAPGPPTLGQAVRALGDGERVEHICKQLHVSGRTMERHFQRFVGIAPKLLGRILRFQRALAALPRGDAASVALACGYADQPHLIRDFREFAGLPPAAYFASAHPLSDHFTGMSDSFNR